MRSTICCEVQFSESHPFLKNRWVLTCPKTSRIIKDMFLWLLGITCHCQLGFSLTFVAGEINGNFSLFLKDNVQFLRARLSFTGTALLPLSSQAQRSDGLGLCKCVLFLQTALRHWHANEVRITLLVLLSGFALYALKIGGNNSKQIIIENKRSSQGYSNHISGCTLGPELSSFYYWLI